MCHVERHYYVTITLSQVGSRPNVTVDFPKTSNSNTVNLVDQKIDICCFITWHSALLGQCNNWLLQYHDNANERDIGPWCLTRVLSMRQNYKVFISERWNKWLHVLIGCCQDVEPPTDYQQTTILLTHNPPFRLDQAVSSFSWGFS